MPAYFGLSAVFWDIATVCFSHRFNENSYIGVLGSLTFFTGVVLLIVLPVGSAQLAGTLLTSISPVAMMSSVAISNNTSGYTKNVFTREHTFQPIA
ncbi:hypothetical protein BDB00DRAFT_804146 [Zychaea mexicana]|uniref:uncharacterized protein n=1 Tax=Zychaea mexicana TaxID=64656 RepID=UPI0022FDBD1F|nr:uncharacterized protein BDB00DRAFT_804146 [Zychaea mexicana]KAI9497362.1 hypothetical protein BDB00DRAFT_804146 [Zychaea mexicana]